MKSFEQIAGHLEQARYRWLITGAAGFIGSHLVERLLVLGQEVVGLDNLSTGKLRNIEDVKERIGAEPASRLTFIHGDVRDVAACVKACAGADFVLHQAALGSVPRSLGDPLSTHQSNATGQLNMLWAAREAGVKRVVYASSSSVYGDHPGLPKVEDCIGRPLSPYAVTKLANELYAGVFARAYGLSVVGLRYFNVFGPRQDPEGPYAAVIPCWILGLLKKRECEINGDGETSRDFCYVDNVVRANILAALAPEAPAGAVYNVACGAQTTLNQLFEMILSQVAVRRPEIARAGPVHRPFREADIRHSLADIGRARAEFGYEPASGVAAGIEATVAWYVEKAAGWFGS